MPAVSVVLPFYNAASTLERAARSILNQSFREFELILIDNNSTDGSVEIGRRLVREDTRVRLLHEERQGVVWANNAGMAAAKGSYLSRMDADDVAHPDKLHLQKVFLDRNPDIDVVSCQVNYIPHQEDTKGFVQYVKWVNGLLRHEEIFLNRFIESPIVNPTAMFRREVMEEHGLYREGLFPEDYELWLRWLEAGLRMEKLPLPLLDWHDSATRLTRTDERYSTLNFYKIKTGYLWAWLQRHNPYHPEVAVWGAGRRSRQRVKLLEEKGASVVSYIDIIPQKIKAAPCIHYSELPPPGQWFILAYVGNWGAREEIKQELLGRGYREGTGFLMVA